MVNFSNLPDGPIRLDAARGRTRGDIVREDCDALLRSLCLVLTKWTATLWPNAENVEEGDDGQAE